MTLEYICSVKPKCLGIWALIMYVYLNHISISRGVEVKHKAVMHYRVLTSWMGVWWTATLWTTTGGCWCVAATMALYASLTCGGRTSSPPGQPTRGKCSPWDSRHRRITSTPLAVTTGWVTIGFYVNVLCYGAMGLPSCFFSILGVVCSVPSLPAGAWHRQVPTSWIKCFMNMLLAPF